MRHRSIADTVELLDEINASDPAQAMDDATELLLDQVDPRIAEAFERVADRAREHHQAEVPDPQSYQAARQWAAGVMKCLAANGNVEECSCGQHATVAAEELARLRQIELKHHVCEQYIPQLEEQLESAGAKRHDAVADALDHAADEIDQLFVLAERDQSSAEAMKQGRQNAVDMLRASAKVIRNTRAAEARDV